MKKIVLFNFLQLMLVAAMAQNNKGFEIVEKPASKQVDILYNGKLLTAYCYYDSIMKPFLYPVNTLDGVTVTRGYPIAPRTGDRTDHPHHVGIWMNYESVNGLDFWNNSTAIPAERKDKYGTIKHDKIIEKKADKDRASLVTTADWIRPDGKIILKEKTVYNFFVRDGRFFIDRTSTLTATDVPVIFKDVKDGFFAIRVARELELPSKEKSEFVDANGNKTTVPALNNDQVTGMYYNSNGVTGDSVWSTKARWAMLKGKKENKEITIGMFDHPSNPGYPTYWHARGYGLFALNPLGRKVFSNGKEELNLSLKPNTSVQFHYRILIASDTPVTKETMNKEADAFERTK
jgi:hypothetical protein